MLKSCANINEAIELNDSAKMMQLLLKDTSFLEQIEPQYADKYMQEFRDDKETNRQVYCYFRVCLVVGLATWLTWF